MLLISSRVPHIKVNMKFLGNEANPSGIFNNLCTPYIVNEILTTRFIKLSKIRLKYRDQNRPELKDYFH